MKLIDQVSDSIFNFTLLSYSGEGFAGKTVSLKEELTFDESNVSNALEQYSLTASLLSQAYCTAYALQCTLEEDLNYQECSLYIRYKDAKSDGKAYADSRIEKMISLHSDVRKLKAEIIAVKTYCLNLKTLIGIYDNRLRALQTYASSLRLEMKGLSYTT